MSRNLLRAQSPPYRRRDCSATRHEEDWRGCHRTAAFGDQAPHPCPRSRRDCSRRAPFRLGAQSDHHRAARNRRVEEVLRDRPDQAAHRSCAGFRRRGFGRIFSTESPSGRTCTNPGSRLSALSHRSALLRRTTRDAADWARSRFQDTSSVTDRHYCGEQPNFCGGHVSKWALSRSASWLRPGSRATTLVVL